MNFADFIFWQLLGSCFLLWITLRTFWKYLDWAWRPEADRVLLLGTSLFLLGATGWKTLGIFIYVASATYFFLWAAQSFRWPARIVLPVLVPLQVAPLLYYKYGNFLGNEILGLDWPWLINVGIPIGISFYTFQKISFVIDTVHYRKPLPSLLDYGNYVSFFPQIVAGPIERRQNLLPQVRAFSLKLDSRNWWEGVPWVVLGFFFKCGLADNLAGSFPASHPANAYLIWYANLLFAFRIYFDFAGYSLIALGLARCLGVRLTLNFLSPYCAKTPAEFWHRWHVSLSQWFRDYLYIPLGGNKSGIWWANLLVVFVVSGIWHGAGWNFILWGLWHGLLLIGFRLLPASFPAAPGRILTLAAVIFSWLFFYETDVSVLRQKCESLFSLAAYGAEPFRGLLAFWAKPEGTLSIVLLFLSFGVVLFEYQSLRKSSLPYEFFFRPWVLIGIILFTVWMAPGKTNAFIYFAF